MQPPADLNVSVVIPVYRGEATVRELVERLLALLEHIADSHEIILVDDASPDGSWKVLEDLREEHPDRVVAIQLMRTSGQHNALMCGLRHARAKYVITMDDDLQHPPEEIPKLLAAIESSGNDVIYGAPDARKHRRWRNVGSTVVTAFYRLVFKTKVQPSPFRIMRREVVEAILSYNLNYTFIDGLLAWNTQRIGQVTVEHRPRANGRSGYTLGKLVLLALNLFTNFSLLPLQVVSALGTLASLGGFALACYYLAQYMFASIGVPGYASTIVAILVLGGLQLLALGILGEYVGRLHLNVNRKPQYTVRHLLGPPDSEKVQGAHRSAVDLDAFEGPSAPVEKTTRASR
jgi:undecaprenyl-phosphate 4-deoxy-4-formamido-L-arabinose transferase